MIDWAFHGMDSYAQKLQGLIPMNDGEEPKEHLKITTLFKDLRLANRLELSEGFVGNNGGGSPIIPPPESFDRAPILAWAGKHGIIDTLKAIGEKKPTDNAYHRQKTWLKSQIHTTEEHANKILEYLT